MVYLTNRIVSIVDDEKDITELFKDALVKNIEDVTVVSFNDPILALEHFISNKDQYALVISDLRMPKISGIELLKKMKESNPLVRTILMTAFELDDLQDKEILEKHVVDKLLQKPIRLDDLFIETNNQLQSYETSVVTTR